MKYKILLAILWLCASTISAQENESGFKHQIVAGFNIGATAPTSIPVEIRSIDGYWPQFNPQLGYKISYTLPASRFGFGTGILLDYKGMGVKATVKSLYTIVNDGENTFEGNFTGKNKTEVKSAYVTLPLYATYRISNKWQVQLGGYASYLFSSEFTGEVNDGYIRIGSPVGERAEIDYADFNFGSEMRTFDFGLSGGGEYSINKRFGVSASLNWGLRPIFAPSFKGIGYKLNNIYGTVGMSYTL